MKPPLIFVVKVKKILKTVDNFTGFEKARLSLILKIQQMRNNGYSFSEISRLLGKDRRTIKKYSTGDPADLCKQSRKRYNKY